MGISDVFVVSGEIVFLIFLYTFMSSKIFGPRILSYHESLMIARDTRKAERVRNSEIKAANAARIKAEGELRAQRELEVKRERERKERARIMAAAEKKAREEEEARQKEASEALKSARRKLSQHKYEDALRVLARSRFLKDTREASALHNQIMSEKEKAALDRITQWEQMDGSTKWAVDRYTTQLMNKGYSNYDAQHYAQQYAAYVSRGREGGEWEV